MLRPFLSLFRQILAYIFLSPWAWLYACGLRLDRYWRAAPPEAWPLTLALGNLSMGGSGKTPHLEALARHLLERGYRIGILSRGYGRKTRGLLELDLGQGDFETYGDEAYYLKRCLPEVPLVVVEQRRLGLRYFQRHYPELELILMDDGLQHWPCPPKMGVVLSPQDRPFYQDYLWPLGNLREPRRGIQRAVALIISKCEEDWEPKRKLIRSQAQLENHQALYFTQFAYQDPKTLDGQSILRPLASLEDYHVLLFTGIARPEKLALELKKRSKSLQHLRFADHHNFKSSELKGIIKRFEALPQGRRLLLCTAKDAVRLQKHRDLFPPETGFIPIEVKALGLEDWRWGLEKILKQALKTEQKP